MLVHRSRGRPDQLDDLVGPLREPAEELGELVVDRQRGVGRHVGLEPELVEQGGERGAVGRLVLDPDVEEAGDPLVVAGQQVLDAETGDDDLDPLRVLQGIGEAGGERLGVQHRVVDPLELERDLALDDVELAVDAGRCGRGGGGHRGLFDTGSAQGMMEAPVPASLARTVARLDPVTGTAYRTP